MKRYVLCLCLALIALSTNAQPGQFPPERMSDDEIIRMQIRDIVPWLGLDKDSEAKFIEEYTAFKKEIDAAIRCSRPPKGMKSEDEIEKAIQQNFSVSEQILQIRKKYYAKFRAFMKPSQIQMMYHIENEAGRRMFGRHGGPGGPGGGPEGHGGGPGGPGGPGCPGGGPDGWDEHKTGGN